MINSIQTQTSSLEGKISESKTTKYSIFWACNNSSKCVKTLGFPCLPKVPKITPTFWR